MVMSLVSLLSDLHIFRLWLQVESLCFQVEKFFQPSNALIRLFDVVKMNN